MLFTIVTATLALLGIFYAILDAVLWWGLLRRTSPILKQIQASPAVSILVCARNEEQNIAECLRAILAQSYAGTLEILVANDRSTDHTATILAEFTQSNPQVRILNIEQVPTGFTPKKNAITQLAKMAQGEILLLTDADCIVPQTWVKEMVACYTDDVDWVSGYSYFYEKKNCNSLLHGVDALDFLSHRTIDAAGIGLGFPITACGQNLSYRKSVFEELQGFAGVAHVTSGDDDLLMHKLAAKRPNAIRYCMQPGSFVFSRSKDTWHEVWEQRKRWASKTTQYNASAVLILSSIFAFYVLILLGLLASLAYGIFTRDLSWFKMFAVAWLWKTVWDALVMAKGMQLFHEMRLWKWFIPTALLHIPMIVGAVLSGLLGKFTWKN